MVKYCLILSVLLAVAYAATNPEGDPKSKPSIYTPPSGYNNGYPYPIGQIPSVGHISPITPHISSPYPSTLGHIPSPISYVTPPIAQIPYTPINQVPGIISQAPAPISQIYPITNQVPVPISQVPIQIPYISAVGSVPSPITYVSPQINHLPSPIPQIQPPIGHIGGVGTPIVQPLPNVYRPNGIISTVPSIGGYVPQHLGYNSVQSVTKV